MRKACVSSLQDGRGWDGVTHQAMPRPNTTFGGLLNVPGIESDQLFLHFTPVNPIIYVHSMVLVFVSTST